MTVDEQAAAEEHLGRRAASGRALADRAEVGRPRQRLRHPGPPDAPDPAPGLRCRRRRHVGDPHGLPALGPRVLDLPAAGRRARPGEPEHRLLGVGGRGGRPVRRPPRRRPAAGCAFGIPELAQVLRALVLSVVPTVLAGVPLALLRRAMAFRAVALQALVAALLAQVVAVVVALGGRRLGAGEPDRRGPVGDRRPRVAASPLAAVLPALRRGCSGGWPSSASRCRGRPGRRPRGCWSRTGSSPWPSGPRPSASSTSRNAWSRWPRS